MPNASIDLDLLEQAVDSLRELIYLPDQRLRNRNRIGAFYRAVEQARREQDTLLTAPETATEGRLGCPVCRIPADTCGECGGSLSMLAPDPVATVTDHIESLPLYSTRDIVIAGYGNDMEAWPDTYRSSRVTRSYTATCPICHAPAGIYCLTETGHVAVERCPARLPPF